MKKELVGSILLLLILNISVVSAQKIQKFKVKNNDESLYFELSEKNTLDAFSAKSEYDSRKEIGGKDNSINIYWKWHNPLVYRLNWKDSVLIDERDKIVKDFTQKLLLTFKIDSSTSGNKGIRKGNQANKRDIFDELKNGRLKLNDTDLGLMYLLLDSFTKNKGKIDSVYWTSLTDSLVMLDELSFKDYSKQSSAAFKKLITADTPDLAQNAVSLSKKEIKGLLIASKKTASLQKTVLKEISNKQIVEDALLNKYAKSVISAFVDRTKKKDIARKVLMKALMADAAVMEASLNAKSKLRNEFFMLRRVTFENGKKLQTKLTVSEYVFDVAKNKMVKKSDIACKQIEFIRHDLFTPFVSTGLFYSNYDLLYFGVKSGSNGNFIITEEKIDKNSPVAALFLNLGIDLNSRYFSPLIQLGIAPAKKHPFLLAGLGFSIPSSRFAISGGPLWTWDASLKNKSVGDEIKSTTELENAIKYEFDVKPKGWYLGLQYSF